jgi:diguanylate cyclase (GGDEF)-like protein
MEPAKQFRKPDIPLWSVLLSFAALGVPAVVTLFFAEFFGDYEVLLWLMALVPAFMLAYYRSWKGVATALAAGMATLSLVQVILLLTGSSLERGALFGGVLFAYVGIGLGLGLLAELIHRERIRAETAALTDSLTGIPNRRYAELMLPREFAGAQRGRDFTVVLFDLDHFKSYNDRHGHRAGDEALQVFAQALMANTRTMNLSARIGGEEFLALLSSTPDTGAEVFARRTQDDLAASPPPAGPITVSAGIAQYHAGMKTKEDLLEAADRALYQAKSDGRNRIVIAPRPGTEAPAPEPGDDGNGPGSASSA